MEAHIESVKDVRIPLGSAIGEEQANVWESSMVAVVANTYPQEMLEVEGIVLQESSIQ